MRSCEDYVSEQLDYVKQLRIGRIGILASDWSMRILANSCGNGCQNDENDLETTEMNSRWMIITLLQT